MMTIQKKNNLRIYDDACLMQDRDDFCKAASFDTAKAIFIPNYVNGLDFVKNDLVDYVALFIADSALTTAKLLIETVRNDPKVLSILEKDPGQDQNPGPDNPIPKNATDLVCVTAGCKLAGKTGSGKFCNECANPLKTLTPIVVATVGQLGPTCQTSGCVKFGSPVTGKFCDQCAQPPKIIPFLVCHTLGCENFQKQITGKFCSQCAKPPAPKTPVCQSQGCENFGKQVAGKFCGGCAQPPST